MTPFASRRLIAGLHRSELGIDNEGEGSNMVDTWNDHSREGI
jgi:hypothetical protein